MSNGVSLFLEGSWYSALTRPAQSSSEHGSRLAMSKSGRAKSHPVDKHAYRSSANINQNNLLRHSSSLQSAAGGMILVLLRLGAGALLGVKFDAARSSSEVRPR